MFRLNRNKQKTHPNSLKESTFGYFSENLGLFQLFRFITKQFCLFRLFRYRFETPKQTEFFLFWFHETNRNKCEPKFIFVCFEDTLIPVLCLWCVHAECMYLFFKTLECWTVRYWNKGTSPVPECSGTRLRYQKPE